MNKLKIEKIKEEILGKDYDLSVAFVSENKIKSLNKKYRKINKPTDVLSFSLQEGLGEILICKKIAQKKKTPILFLVIHAVLHLKGMEHSSKMEAYERAYYNRYRCGHL